MDEHIYPAEERYEDEIEANTAAGKRWTPLRMIEELKPKARAAGLWNLFLPPTAGGEGAPQRSRFGLSNQRLRAAGRDHGPRAVGERGLQLLGARHRQHGDDRALRHRRAQGALARAAARGQDPQRVRDDRAGGRFVGRDQHRVAHRSAGDDYVINGRKWWTCGAGDPRCKIYIFMGKTDPDAPRHSQQSMILVPADTPGIKVLRPLSVFGYDDAPHGHMEVAFDDVRVPASNILLGEGRGFEIAQGRLGPGRIHHCMRLIGLAERALELMCKRATSRVAFGRTMAEQGVTRERIAEARCRIDMARLLTLKAAWMMDVAGNKAAKAEIAMIKVVAPHMACQVIDWAMQVHGGGGMSATSRSPTSTPARARCASPTAPTKCTATRSPRSNSASTR